MKRKLFTTLALASILTFSALASVPLRRTFSYTQTDGTRVTLTKQAVAGYAFYATTDGIAIVKGEDGNFHYALSTSDGITASGVVAHNEDERNEDENAFINNQCVSAEECARLFSEQQPSRSVKGFTSSNNGLGTYRQSANGAVKSIGTLRIPVVLVEYADMKFNDAHTTEKYDRWFNEPDYAEEQFCKGCIGQYFSSQSDSLFVPEFDVLGKVCVSKGYAYYGEDTSASRTDKNKEVLVNEIADSLTARGTDMTPYLSDGKVPLLAIIHAGPGQQSSFENGCEDYIYASFRETTKKVNGQNVGSYLITCEIFQEYEADSQGNPVVVGSKIDGIGTFCHEFSHALGLPDYYATNGAATETPDVWAIMDYGQYVYDGYCPTGYGAYERSFMGWLEIQELGDEPEEKELYALGTKDKPTAYLIRNNANAKEYYILENRQDSPWFASFLGVGMLVTHVDYDQNTWNTNKVNNTASHPRISVIRADGKFQRVNYPDFSTNVKGDLYPGTTGNTELTDESTPAATVFTGNTLGKPLYNIAMSADGIITFSYLSKTATGIDGVADAPQTEAFYSLDGRRMTATSEVELPTGTYIKVTTAGTEKIFIR